MYAAFDDKEHVIAYHDRRKVVEAYIENVYKYNDIYLRLKKIRKRDMDILDGLDDLYLVVYGETYLQSGYVLYMDFVGDQICRDEQYAIDVLYRLLEIRNIKNRDRKKIVSAIEVLEDVLYDDNAYTPTLDELKTMKDQYDPYIYNYRYNVCE